MKYIAIALIFISMHANAIGRKKSPNGIERKNQDFLSEAQVSGFIEAVNYIQVTEPHESTLRHFVKVNSEKIRAADVLRVAKEAKLYATNESILRNFAWREGARLTANEIIQLAKACKLGESRDSILKHFAWYEINRLTTDEIIQLAAASKLRATREAILSYTSQKSFVPEDTELKRHSKVAPDGTTIKAEESH
jgi:hypothetical protein